MEKKPELSVILINYNDKDNLKECLLSLQEHLSPSLAEILVVDNSSSDGSVDFLQQHFPEVRLICNSENVGYARANNQGIRESRGKYILLLNTDTVVYPYTLNVLLEEIKANVRAGAAGPLLFSRSGECQVSFGRKVSFWGELLQKGFLNAYFKSKLKRSKKKREVDWLSGACLMSRRDVLEEAGLFDGSFFLYFEDIDLCTRIRQKGWTLIFQPQARVLHKGGASTSNKRLLSRFHYRKSQLYFYRKHNSRASLFFLRVYLRLIFFVLWALAFGKRREDREMRRKFWTLLSENEKN